MPRKRFDLCLVSFITDRGGLWFPADPWASPTQIAHNGALLENTWVMFVSILNRIPVFVVGKPGNSKSLAMHLLNSSLRRGDSHDPLLKKLPGV